jgi:hypothetical protein
MERFAIRIVPSTQCRSHVRHAPGKARVYVFAYRLIKKFTYYNERGGRAGFKPGSEMIAAKPVALVIQVMRRRSSSLYYECLKNS